MARPKKIKEESNVAVVEKEPSPVFEKVVATEPATKKEEIILIAPPTEKEMNRQKLHNLINAEIKLVKGRFRNFESPGQNLRVQIRKYPGIPPFDMVMEDNKIYEIPIYVARHLNGVDISAGGGNTKINSCAYPTHGFLWDKDKPPPANAGGDNGMVVPIIGVQKWNRRFGFDSMEFDTTN